VPSPLHSGAMRAFSKREVREFYQRLAATRPIPQTELEFINPFTLLVAVVLSAQATDTGVNKATPALFALADNPEKMLALGEERLVELIRTIGLFRTKARNLMALSRILVEQYDGEVPRDRAALEALPGVGRKTANVVLNVAFGEPTIAVDTHIFRVANRTGLAPGKTPLAVEMALDACTPAEYKRYAHHWLILHGRYICKARKPECPECVVAGLCRYGAKTGPAEMIAARAALSEPAALAEPPPAGRAGRRTPGATEKSRVSLPRGRSPRRR
jgi:endonuclease-3